MGLSGFAKFLQPDKTNSKRRLWTSLISPVCSAVCKSFSYISHLVIIALNQFICNKN